MLDLSSDEGIFVRSMATRGSLGGLSQKAGDAVKLMDAFGFDIIIIETVGVGQSEVDIVKTADTTMVVVIPGMGDDIQAIKAGILEIGDLFTINKADREGTDKLNIEIEMMLELNPEHVSWRPPINRTIASKGEGIEAVVDSIEDHQKYLTESGEVATYTYFPNGMMDPWYAMKEQPQGGYNTLYNGNISIGVGTVGGMLIGTVALLFIVPVLFIVFQSIQERVMPDRQIPQVEEKNQ